MYNLSSIISPLSANNLKSSINAETGDIQFADAKRCENLVTLFYERIQNVTSTIVFINPDANLLTLDNDTKDAQCCVNMIGLNAECQQLDMYNVSLFDVMYKLLKDNSKLTIDVDHSIIRLNNIQNIEAYLLGSLLNQCISNSDFYITSLLLDCIYDTLEALKQELRREDKIEED